MASELLVSVNRMTLILTTQCDLMVTRVGQQNAHTLNFVNKKRQATNPLICIKLLDGV